jgi:hypothetical protein
MLLVRNLSSIYNYSGESKLKKELVSVIPQC